MPDTSKLEKLNRELEKSEKKLRKAINDEKVLQHQLQQLVNAFMTQKFDESDMVCSFKTNHVEFESPNEIAWTLDGEFGGSLKKTVFDVMPKAVDFIVRGKKKKS